MQSPLAYIKIEPDHDALCEATLFDHMSEVPMHCPMLFSPRDFFDGWDITPPDSPTAQRKHIGVSEFTLIRGQEHPSSPEIVASVMWNLLNDDGGYEQQENEPSWTPPPSPIPLSEFSADSDFQPFNLEDGNYYEEVLSASVPPLCKKRKSSDSNKNPKKRHATTRQPKKEVPSPEDASYNESDDPEDKRFMHNVLERKRRQETKYSYQILREQIPDLRENSKTPTGLILNRAVQFIAELKDTESQLLRELNIARAENARLLSL